MSNLTTDMGVDVLRSSIIGQLKGNAKRLKVEIDSVAPGDALFSLIEGTAEKHGVSVVVLVDEYDKPILDHIHDIEKAGEIRGILRNFYVRIKAADAYLRFVFITGISKFSKTGAFSSMNNLIDISMNDRYAVMLGYTEEELLSCFRPYIGDTAAKLGESEENLVACMHDYYDGFSFDGKNMLYNPFTMLNFFNDPTFKNYWFETGTPSFLVEYAKKHDLEVENFRGLEVPENFTSATEIERASPESFLFQSGYLSVREKRGIKLVLDYPNMEVLSSVADLFLWSKTEAHGTGVASADLEVALGKGQAEELIKIYNSLLASVPYDLYERGEVKYARAREEEEYYKPVYHAESFYHSLLLALIWASRVKTSAENHSYRGRSDVEAEKNGYRYVIELKIADGKEAARKAADEAMKQIRDKGYADKYAATGATLIAMAVDRERWCVTEYRIEKL
jgi:hypothetical protein